MHHSRPARVLLRGLAAPLALGGVLGGLNPGFSNVLGGVDTTSPHDVWAVGTAGGEVDGNQAFAVHCC
jgi:hypothetical protein